ncbi:MAG: hypothetical protein ACT4NK_07790 [Limnobacter sp.]|uniref:hypothetical protein n=1 Tax=Limnobacter sp. TaxID=2003368 RepID=UPI004037908D
MKKRLNESSGRRKGKLAQPLNTYEGRQVVPKLVGWMLMDPSQMLRLYGTSVTRILSDQYGEAMAKAITRLMNGSLGEKASMKLLSEIIPRDETTLPIREAIDGDPIAQKKIMRTGIWQLFADGLGALHKPEYLFLIDIESRCTPILLARQQGKHSDVTRLIAEDDLLGNFIAESDLDACVRNPDMIHALQFKMYLEGQLSFVALLDVLHSEERAPRYRQLLPSNEWTEQNSAARFFGVILESTDLPKNPTNKQLADLLVDPLGQKDFDERTIRRWRSGETMIPIDTALIVSDRLSVKITEMELFNYWKAAVHINDFWFLIEAARSAFQSLAKGELKNFNVLPFGYQSVGQWCSERYEFWLNFHRERGMPSHTFGTATFS